MGASSSSPSSSGSKSSGPKSSGSDPSSSKSGSSGTKTGEEWTYKIYFDPEADKCSGDSHYIGDSELIDKLTDLVDIEEEIINIRVYKQKLSSWQVTQLLFCHMFIVFETKDWWWSIEKNSEGITIQRSKAIEAVRDQYRQSNRTDIQYMVEDKGRKSMRDLITWLYRENELKKKYNWLSSNCKHFAKAAFDHVAETKYL